MEYTLAILISLFIGYLLGLTHKNREVKKIKTKLNTLDTLLNNWNLQELSNYRKK